MKKPYIANQNIQTLQSKISPGSEINVSSGWAYTCRKFLHILENIYSMLYKKKILSLPLYQHIINIKVTNAAGMKHKNQKKPRFLIPHCVCLNIRHY